MGNLSNSDFDSSGILFPAILNSKKNTLDMVFAPSVRVRVRTSWLPSVDG